MSNKEFDHPVEIKFNIYGIKRNENKSSLLNEIKLNVYSKDSIEQIKRMLSIKLYNLLNEDSKKKACPFCFKKSVIKSKPTKLKSFSTSVSKTVSVPLPILSLKGTKLVLAPTNGIWMVMLSSLIYEAVNPFKIA